MLGNSIPMVPPAQCSALAGFEHSPVNIIPEPCRTGMGLTWGRRVSFCQPPQAASSPCPAAGDGTSTCAPPGVSALGVQRRGVWDQEGGGTVALLFRAFSAGGTGQSSQSGVCV